jgi:hypothetical protein
VDRADPVALLEEQNLTREPDLVPVRHGRMMVSPFTFYYRGAAKIMAADLDGTLTAGLVVHASQRHQLLGPHPAAVCSLVALNVSSAPRCQSAGPPSRGRWLAA